MFGNYESRILHASCKAYDAARSLLLRRDIILTLEHLISLRFLEMEILTNGEYSERWKVENFIVFLLSDDKCPTSDKKANERNILYFFFLSFFFLRLGIGSRVPLEFGIGTPRSRAPTFLRRRMQKRACYVHRIRDRMQRCLLKCGQPVVNYVKRWFPDESDPSAFSIFHHFFGGKIVSPLCKF